MDKPYGQHLREALSAREILPFIGIYDVMSASVAARHFDALFLSGFGFAASHYGLPDIGFIAWPDIVQFVQRIRGVLPNHHLLVDIDDGYCDVPVACHVTRLLEQAGASGVILEDQQRPRRCGHYEGKRILPLDEFLRKLESVLATRRDLFVVARTDASDPDEILRRVAAFSAAGADAILVDAIPRLELYAEFRNLTELPFVFNQIAGGKSPRCTLSDLSAAGVSLVIYSTPCLFAAQSALDDAMRALQARDGLLPDATAGGATVKSCTSLLMENMRCDLPAPQPVTVRSAPHLVRERLA